ncbi:hypothetical protein ACQ4PT_043201 [Festuca glaucescens]
MSTGGGNLVPPMRRSISSDHRQTQAQTAPPWLRMTLVDPQCSARRLDRSTLACSMEMEEMRNCYDSVMSTATGTSSVYEFAEVMEEMETCLLEKTAIDYDDKDSGELPGSALLHVDMVRIYNLGAGLDQ